MAEAFLLLHGLEGSGPRHWQSWIAGRLRGHGYQVAFPDLPDADAPSIEAWLRALEAELAQLTAAETTVVCHSLGCLLWLHRDGPPVARALLVAPTQPDVEVPGAVGFRPTPMRRTGARLTRLVCSTDDPWCPPERSRRIAADLHAPVEWLERAGHINADSGYGPWPDLEAWCLAERDSLG